MAQPAAGTSLPSTSLTTGIVFARNEADTTASTQVAGALAYTLQATCVMSWGSDADGRYKQKVSGGYEKWNGLTIGAERTFLVMVKFANSGGQQALIDSDASGPRYWQFNTATTGIPAMLVFDAGVTVIGTAYGPAVSTTAAVPVLARIRNDAGTYKLRIDTNGVAGTEISLSGTPISLSNTFFGTGDRTGGGQPSTHSKVYLEVIWDRALTDGEMTTVGADGYAIFASGGGPQTIIPGLFTNTNAFYGPTLTYDQTLTPGLFTNDSTFYSATVSLAGGSQSLTPGLFSNANAFYAATVARVPGFLTPVLKNNTGTVLASETGVACNVYNASTGALVVRKTGLTSSAAGIVSVTDAAMAAGTTYAYEIVLSAARRLPVAAA